MGAKGLCGRVDEHCSASRPWPIWRDAAKGLAAHQAKAVAIWNAQRSCLRPGHGEVKFAVSYKKGVAALQNEGVLEAAVKGHHGWYWKNRGKQPVEVDLTTVGTPQSSGCCERRASQAVLAVTVGMQA